MIPETVLIETLWNVNQADEWLFSRKSEVLIETLWNVNEKNRRWHDVCKHVLIETLWNVNPKGGAGGRVPGGPF